MANAEDEISPYASGGAGEKLCKMPFRPEIYEEAQNVSHEAGRDISCLSSHQCGNFATFGKSELEEMLKQTTFTRSEAQHFISLLHSSTSEEEKTPTPISRLEASITSGSLKRHKHGFKVSTICRQDSKLINNNATSTCLPITSPQHPATMENLPDELLSNIFIRLLATQLAQMRSVSKSWNALLSQSSFIKSHLHHSIHNNDQIFLFFHNEEVTNFKLTNFIKPPVNPQIQPEYITGIRVIGSVNCLICSSYNGDSFIQIWNPSLSVVLTLPPYSTTSTGDRPIKIHLRFGYDPKTDDYKVVKLTGLHGPYINVVEWWLQIEIYSMRKGSWELITERFPSHIPYIISGDYGCVDGHDGHLHWLGENKDSERIILSFDLGSETFREILIPNSMLDYKNGSNVMGVLAGKLCVMLSGIENDVYEMWVMEEYGVAESWVKCRVFSQFSPYIYLFGFTPRNEILFEDEGDLVLYDPSTNKQKILANYCPEEDGVDKIVEYVDSLVWIARA